MSSRGATAASSRRVKQDLVRLLFGQEAMSASSRFSNACRAKTLDHSVYSYTDLRSAYLKKLQQYHPDKQYSTKDSNQTTYATRHSLFVELQEAWDRYDQQAKISRMVDTDYNKDGDGGVNYKDRNFTMFGVGCSFSDNDAERDLRNEIMDQAGRGWFSAGSLAPSSYSTASATASTSATVVSSTSKHSILDADDDMFVTTAKENTEANVNDAENNLTADNTRHAKQEPKRNKPSLVDRKFRPRSVIG